MFGLQIGAPLHGIVPGLACIQKDLYGLSIGYSVKRSLHDESKPLPQPFVHEVEKQFEILLAGIQNFLYHPFQKIFSAIHILLQIAKGDFRFNHPKFASVTGRIRVFRAEGRAEGVDFS